MKNLIRGLLLLTATSLVACSSAEGDWNQANTQGTIAAYQAFLSKHPDNQHATAANQRIQTLQDDQAWTSAQATNTLDAYQQYLTAQPNGTHVQDAHDRTTGLQRAAAWQSAKADGTASALQAFLDKYPQGSEADQARTQLQQFDSRVQLGTFRSAKQADQARTRLQSRSSQALLQIVVMPPAGASKDYHVVSDAMTREQATAACAKLKKASLRCEVVKNEASAKG